MENLGTGNYDDNDKKYWTRMQSFFKNERYLIKKSKSVIKVDFKNKKVISGTKKTTKYFINKAA